MGLVAFVGILYSQEVLSKKLIIVLSVVGIALFLIFLAFKNKDFLMDLFFKHEFVSKELSPVEAGKYLKKFYLDFHGIHVFLNPVRTYYEKREQGEELVCDYIVKKKGDILPFFRTISLSRGKDHILGGSGHWDMDRRHKFEPTTAKKFTSTSGFSEELEALQKIRPQAYQEMKEQMVLNKFSQLPVEKSVPKIDIVKKEKKDKQEEDEE